MINYTVLIVSFAAQFTVVFDMLAFRPRDIIADADSIPTIWSLVTCVIFEANIFFLCLHMLILNYLVN